MLSVLEAGHSSVVKHLLMIGRSLDQSHLVDPLTIPRSNQYSTTGVTKAMVCATLSVGWCC